LKPANFEYHAPRTTAEAVELLGELGDGTKVLAGGQSLVPMLSLRLATFDHLVDIGGIASLKGIARDEGVVEIGAGTVDASVGTSGDVTASVPLLTRATPLIGHFQNRNRGTIGGSIAHADPAAEYPAVALALDAEMVAVSPRGVRSIAAADFFTGFWTTTLEPEELLIAIRFPVWTGRRGFGVREFARRHGDFAVAGAVVGLEVSADDRIERCAIGLFGLGPTPVRAPVAEREALGRNAALDSRELAGSAVSDLSQVPSDLHGSASYRRRVGAAMLERAWNDAIGEATRG
jgi:aerobic carbon-monoxide dehydrogenase medium subunit